MGLILCIETGTDICSVGIAKDGKLISLRENDRERNHARNIAVYADDIFRQLEIKPSELSAVAVGRGPGSYTGLRIGVSFAKGLCYALGIPLIAIDSTESLAHVAAEDFEAGIVDIEDEEWRRAVLCPMIDARRMEVYYEILDAEFNTLAAVSAEVVTEESFSEFITADRPFVIFGNGAHKCKEVLTDPSVKYIDVAPSARGLCEAAQRKFDKGEFENAAYFEPFYLKDFVATKSTKKLF